MDKIAFRLNKTTFQKLSFEEANRKINDLTGLSRKEKVDHFHYLMSVACQFVGKPWPKMDETHFDIRSGKTIG